MRNITKFGFLLATALALPTASSAQRPGEVTVFANPNFTGRSFTINGPRNNLTLLFVVRSVRVTRGETWELCTRSDFRSPCNHVAQNVNNIRWNVASARPLSAQLPGPGGPGGGGGGPGGPSLRGMSAQFFTMPSDNRGRVISCASGAAACARDSANRFCRSHGWIAASYHRQETVNRTNFLADVLCTRTGG